MLVRSMSVTTGSIVTEEFTAAEFVGGGYRLRKIPGDIGFVEEYLPLEIAEFDEIAVDDADKAHAGADEIVRQHGPEGSAAADGDPAVDDAFLARLADAIKSHLPASNVR